MLTEGLQSFKVHNWKKGLRTGRVACNHTPFDTCNSENFVYTVQSLDHILLIKSELLSSENVVTSKNQEMQKRTPAVT
jgi:hypothetical protein